jgi:hypothetical protein
MLATRQGARQKLLPVLITTDPFENVLDERKNDFAKPPKNGIRGVFGPLGFDNVLTSPKRLRRL